LRRDGRNGSSGTKMLGDLKKYKRLSKKNVLLAVLKLYIIVSYIL